MGPKFNHMSPYKREEEGDLTWTEEDKRCDNGSENWSETKECQQLPEAGRSKAQMSPLESREGTRTYQRLDLGTVIVILDFGPPEGCEINFCC